MPPHLTGTQLLQRADKLRQSEIRHGGCSSAGRASGCGPECRGFEPRHSPQFYQTMEFVMNELTFDVLIEIPAGSRNKYEVDKKSGKIRLDRMLFTSTRYPWDYGYVENTLGLDGDPIDALVMLDEPTFPGCVVKCRVIGMFRMTDESGGDDKLLCVPAGDVRKEHLRDIHHISEYDRLEIQHFFEVYKDLEPGKSVEGATWVGRVEAEKEIHSSFDRYKG